MHLPSKCSLIHDMKMVGQSVNQDSSRDIGEFQKAAERPKAYLHSPTPFLCVEYQVPPASLSTPKFQGEPWAAAAWGRKARKWNCSMCSDAQVPRGTEAPAAHYPNDCYSKQLYVLKFSPEAPNSALIFRFANKETPGASRQFPVQLLILTHTQCTL